MLAKQQRPCAVIVGAGGQDGFYLGDYLVSLGYRVIGLDSGKLTMDETSQPFDILDRAAVGRLIEEQQPKEIYYLAAYHHSSQETQGDNLRRLFAISYEVHCQGLLNFLDSIATHSPATRLFYAGSSLVFGAPAAAPQTEATPLAPICAYGVTKTAGIGMCRVYRSDRSIYCCSGFLYNHESPRRNGRFVTKKIVQSVGDILDGKSKTLALGAPDAQVDWSYAGDVVRAMHAMLQLAAPQDFIVASGVLHTVRDFAERAFALVGLDYSQYVVETPSALQRSLRRVPLLGDPTRLRAATNWQPEVSFDALVELMMKDVLSMRRSNGQ